MANKDNIIDNSVAGFATRAVRDGQVRTHENEHSEAIFIGSGGRSFLRLRQIFRNFLPAV